MLRRLPRDLPPPALLLADLCNPAPREIARHLGLSERTVWRYQADGWPRCAHLALFYASSWGWSMVDCDAHRAVTLYRDLARSHQAERDDVRAQLQALQAPGLLAARLESPTRCTCYRPDPPSWHVEPLALAAG